ncbi:hypothetical protein AA12717_3331 [Gluconacetobacter sacchari DSM 12717]|uniref:Uncharacterized protein n=1 Tax=Gluconacetobacter sacchari DSM 12717 TaxID=1307940 RepID=A0ABQ0PB23_9PROT|nr:hypothetical protein AA12717_3331 [Gluconacetobacter sacchari DSM 12717]
MRLPALSISAISAESGNSSAVAIWPIGHSPRSGATVLRAGAELAIKHTIDARTTSRGPSFTLAGSRT